MPCFNKDCLLHVKRILKLEIQTGDFNQLRIELVSFDQ